MLNGKYRLLGTQELNVICDFCGKKEFTRVYTVEETETGTVLYFGSSCIKKALKITRKELTSELNKQIALINEKFNPMIFAAGKPGRDYYNSHFRKDVVGGVRPFKDPEYMTIVNACNKDIKELEKARDTKIKKFKLN